MALGCFRCDRIAASTITPNPRGGGGTVPVCSRCFERYQGRQEFTINPVSWASKYEYRNYWEWWIDPEMIKRAVRIARAEVGK